MMINPEPNKFRAMRYHEMFAKAILIHNACEMIRRDNRHLSRHKRELVQEFLYMSNLETVIFLEPFSLELWLKAMVCWDKKPTRSTEEEDTKEEKTHNLEALWMRLSKEAQQVIEEEYEYYKKCINLRASFETMQSAFPRWEWEKTEMDGIRIPKIRKVMSHYKKAFEDNRYKSPMKAPKFADSKQKAIKERGFQIGLTCARAAMRETLYKEALTEEEEKDYVIDPFSHK